MPSLLSGCLLLLSCLAVCAAQETGQTLDLTSAHPVPVLLTPEHSATLRFAVSGSEDEEVFLDAAVPDISYRIIASDGKTIRSGVVGTLGWMAIPLAAEGLRQVRIQLKTENGAEGLPGVRVRAELHSISPRTLDIHRRAAQLFNAAQGLHRSLRAEDLRQAIGRFRQAAGEWARAGDPYGEALALGGKGESEIELSRYADAALTLDRALNLGGENAYLRGWLLHLGARALFDQWQGKQAASYAEKELKLGEQAEDAALIAQARTDLACVAFWLRDDEMGKIADKARDEATAAGVPETLAWDLHWKGWIEEYYERELSAMRVLNDSEASFRRAGDSRNAQAAVSEIAGAVILSGDYYSALVTFLKLDPAIQVSGNDMEYGNNLASIGFQYQHLNNPRLAEVYYRKADPIYARAHLLYGRVVSQSYLCETEIQANETATAVQDCKHALTLARQFGDASFLGEALYDVGRADREAGALTEAVVDFQDAVKSTSSLHHPRYEYLEHIQLGELLELQGKHGEALAEFEQAKALSQSVADPASLLEAQYTVARWYAKDGLLADADEDFAKADADFAEADAQLKPALEKLEAARQSVSNNTLQASYFAAERKCYELAVELRMRRFDREPAGEADALALEMSERSRARGLLDALSAGSVPGARESHVAQTGLMQANRAVDRAFDRRLKLLVENGNKRDLDANSAELTQALGDLERAADEVNSARSQPTKPADTVSTAAVEGASLSAGVTFFEFAMGENRSYLWVIGAGKLKSYVLPSRGQLNEMVKQWRAMAASRERADTVAAAKFQRLSSRLSCDLFSDSVQPGMTRMVIVPDGELAMLPFAALPENGCSPAPGEPLVMEHEITLTPSLSVFLARRPETEHRSFQGEVAIVADPVFDAADSRTADLKFGIHKAGSRLDPDRETGTELPRLVSSGYEARAIRDAVHQAAGGGQVFLAQGFDANVETILGPAMQGYRVWHLATHGVYDESNPEFSGLVFSLLEHDGSPRFGFLKAHDIARLSVPADLVVLSACDSAAGENVNGEGVMGLSYAFLRAGAKQVISTLWSIDDAKSKELMIAFYQEFLRNGGSAPQALRLSQTKLMRTPATSAPYYWAGFTLTTAATN
ncbi:MAG: CHAT domain-containing protein [Terracidiphilus sp.]